MTDQTRTNAAKAIKQLMEARAALARVQCRIERETEATAPGSRDEKIALQLTRCINHLGEAVADIPTELWCAMIKDADIDVETLRKNLNAA